MRGLVIGLLVAVPLLTTPLRAQEAPGPGHIEVGVFPVGGIFFTNSSSASEPDFGNFALGATVTYTVNRWIGVEAEMGSALGVKQRMRVANVATDEQRSPTLYSYSGGVVVNPVGARGSRGRRDGSTRRALGRRDVQPNGPGISAAPRSLR